MTSQQIRQQFIDFFVQQHAHTFVPSSPVVPLDDETLLFANAGMNQFKPIFLGQEKRAYTRAANTQKCIRAGGKHNDLDDVGRSRRHQTFFEMLGNWSFGDYFKRGAIEMAWELLTGVFKLDPQRLHVSCYEGDAKAGMPRDTEAAELWKQVACLPDDHIHYFGKDNFWEMGDTGPCGPCTEIYYDRTPDKSGGSRVNGDDPRIMEIWNLVFIQYNRDAAGKLTTLPAQHVDTGMGLERLCQVLQGQEDNYATDLFTPLFDALTAQTRIKYTGKFPPTNAPDPVAEAADPQLRHDIAFRVVADHIRCLTFALTDGAVPSNEGRGYVLRRILRRAVRFGRQHLGLSEPFMHKLVPVVVQTMGPAFPEIQRHPQQVIELIKEEEVSFGKTLDRGIQLFEEAAKAGGISAADAFKLHDTYGFPIDLTRIMAEERALRVDIAGYEKLMEEARQRARLGGKAEAAQVLELPPSALAQLAADGVKPTDDQSKFRHEPISAHVAAIWNGDSFDPATDATVVAGEQLAIILHQTNFYAEMGGQIGDAGELKGGEGAIFEVEASHAVGGYVLHVGRVRQGRLRVRDTVTATVLGSRPDTEKNHTATHLANWALRKVLGDAVAQKGSLVDPQKLRFDFTCAKAMSDEQLEKVESLVNEAIGEHLVVHAQTVPLEQALGIQSLRAVFGEKYPPLVRVVSVGVPVGELLADPSNAKWRQYAIELCGGTHLGNSTDIVAFAIMSEESVAKGIRRLVALTGDAARKAGIVAAAIEQQIEQALAMADADLSSVITAIQKAAAEADIPLRSRRKAQNSIAQLQARYKAFEKTRSASKVGQGQVDAVGLASELMEKAPTLGGGKIIIGEIPDASDEQLRSAVDSLKKKTASYGIMLAAIGGGKVSFVAAVSDDLVAKGLKAGDWIRDTAKAAGGGGGGRPQMAQAGGKDPAKLAEALEVARAFVGRVLK